ncbi:hypothetical protein [Actinomadura madurae]|nr:hypothetical protein [Actinomadura madurae]
MTAEMASRSAEVRASVAAESTKSTPSSATTKPQLLMNQPPSGWI